MNQKYWIGICPEMKKPIAGKKWKTIYWKLIDAWPQLKFKLDQHRLFGTRWRKTAHRLCLPLISSWQESNFNGQKETKLQTPTFALCDTHIKILNLFLKFDGKRCTKRMAERIWRWLNTSRSQRTTETANRTSTKQATRGGNLKRNPFGGWANRMVRAIGNCEADAAWIETRAPKFVAKMANPSCQKMKFLKNLFFWSSVDILAQRVCVVGLWNLSHRFQRHRFDLYQIFASGSAIYCERAEFGDFPTPQLFVYFFRLPKFNNLGTT